MIKEQGINGWIILLKPFAFYLISGRAMKKERSCMSTPSVGQIYIIDPKYRDSNTIFNS